MSDELESAADTLRKIGWDVHCSTEDPESDVPGLTARRGQMSIVLSPHVMHEHNTYPDWVASLCNVDREPRHVDSGTGASPITAIRDAGVQV